MKGATSEEDIMSRLNTCRGLLVFDANKRKAIMVTIHSNGTKDKILKEMKQLRHSRKINIKEDGRASIRNK